MPNINPFQQFGNYGYPGNGVTNNYYGVPPPAGSSGPPTTSGNFDPLTFGLETGGAIYANSRQAAGANTAANLSVYNPYNISGPGGMGVSSGPNGYNLNGPTSGPFAQFGDFATNSIGYGANNVGTNPFDTAAGSTLSAFQNFDPNAFANNEYQQLSTMAAPGVTDQIQGMENFEQKSGRSGLTQNGQLGDVGGLDLALRTADTNRQLQAITDARNQGNYLAGLSSTFSGDANNLRTNASNIGTNGLTGELGINAALQQYLQQSIAASSARAQAGANAGQFRYLGGMNTGNNVGNYFGALGQTLNNSGGALNFINKMFPGSGNNTPSGGDGNPAGGTYDPSSGTYGNGYQPGQFGQPDYSPQVSYDPNNPSSGDSGDYSGYQLPT